MKVYLTRDSVCAGDDCLAPHARNFSIPRKWDLETLVQRTMDKTSLPQIEGGKATWALSSNIPILVFAQQWEKPALIFGAINTDRFDIEENLLRLHWSYFSQMDPDFVFKVLNSLRLTAIR